MADISDALRHDLQQTEFSEGYAESFLDSFIATQLKVLREQNGWNQTQLGDKMGKKQTVISRSENINYSSWNISTLKQYARAFRLRLRVSFETYGSLIDEVANFSRENLQRAPRESDPALKTGPNAGYSQIHLVPMPQIEIGAYTLPNGNEYLDSIAQGHGSLSGNNSSQAIPPGRASSQAGALGGAA